MPAADTAPSFAVRLTCATASSDGTHSTRAYVPATAPHGSTASSSRDGGYSTGWQSLVGPVERPGPRGPGDALGQQGHHERPG
ncbi:hypothetical protein [Streptomyces sp. NPDC093598]|uniref:hypothetical protein n=1 Tax=Streptomyces sp. NPDC093598 TaxID=3366046 RepID=UPI0038155C94